MEINNNLLNVDVQDPIDSSQLSYEGNTEVGKSVSKATDNSLQRRVNVYEMRHRPSRTHPNHEVRVLLTITLTRVLCRILLWNALDTNIFLFLLSIFLVIGLEHSRRIWKMMSEHMEYIW